MLLVAGSRGKTGAAHLGAVAALRSGAGLVTVATPASCLPIVASMGAEYMTVALDELRRRHASRARARDAVIGGAHDVLATGPGPRHGPGPAGASSWPLLERSAMPLVLDADALTVAASSPAALHGSPERPVVITPHPGEMARLIGAAAADVQRHRLEVARDFATAHHVYVILKGYRTLVATPEGIVYINPTGQSRAWPPAARETC